MKKTLKDKIKSGEHPTVRLGNNAAGGDQILEIDIRDLTNMLKCAFTLGTESAPNRLIKQIIDDFQNDKYYAFEGDFGSDND
jgi:hypothetical protein